MPRRGRKVTAAVKVACAVLIAFAAIAAAAAASAVCGVFLAVLLITGIIVRIPPRWALWAMAFGGWPAYSLIFATVAHAVIAGVFTSGACIAALAWLRSRQRGQWRETSGRMDGHRHVRRSSGITARRIDALEQQFGALTITLAASYNLAQVPVPAGIETAGAPKRHLRVVRDDDTKPLPVTA